MAAIETFPPFEPIKRTPGTIGDFNKLVRVSVRPSGFVIDWDTVNVYTDRSLKTALRGVCEVSPDGRRVTSIRLRQ